MNNFTIKKNNTLIEALEKINVNRSKHLIVLNDNGKAVGILSDGDIRRSILKKKKLNSKIKEIYNSKFHYFLQENLDKEKALEYMINNNILFAPILNSKNIPIDILTIRSKEIKRNKILNTRNFKEMPTVVIMAGGQGKRMQPFTSILPKPLIPVGNLTVIENIINNFRDFNVKKFYITLNYKSKIIKSFLSDSKIKKYLNFFIEKKPLGTIGSLKYLDKKLGSNFILTNSDSLIDIDVNEFVDFHVKNNNTLTLAVAIKKFENPYGECVINNKGNLTSILEKPKHNFMINTGLYMVKKEVLKYIKKNKRMDMDELLNNLIKKNKKIKVFPISENSWKDVGRWEEYNKL